MGKGKKRTFTSKYPHWAIGADFESVYALREPQTVANSDLVMTTGNGAVNSNTLSSSSPSPSRTLGTEDTHSVLGFNRNSMDKISPIENRAQ